MKLNSKSLTSILTLTICFCWCCEKQPAPADRSDAGYFESVKQHRVLKNINFKESANSPIPANARDEFTGLKYFALNPDLKFEVPLHRFERPDTLYMMTTKGTDRRALRYGYFEFEVNGSKQKLYAYEFVEQSEETGHLFLPFFDSTSGEETYGGGRYIDLKINERDRYILDFNLAYNPSCAYGLVSYVCPIPPDENTLTVPIRAGEKKWK